MPARNSRLTDEPLRFDSEEFRERLSLAWLERLSAAYSAFNWSYLKGALRPPQFALTSDEHRLGAWNGAIRRISISASHIAQHSWEHVLETLRHEMAHQYVEEVLCLSQSPPHGEAFARACKLLRVEPAARAAPGQLDELRKSNHELDRMLVRIEELFALAKSPNEHEAANAMRLANKLLLKYNLAPPSGERAARRYITRHLRRTAHRVYEYENHLSHILHEYYFVEVLWCPSYDARQNTSATVLQVCGTPENVEIAGYVFDYVHNLVEPLWSAHKRDRSVSDRGSKWEYLAGLMAGLDEKLKQQRSQLAELHGLVWCGDKELNDYYRYLHPRISVTRGAGALRGAGYEAGRADGREITIHKGVDGGAREAGKALPPQRSAGNHNQR
ncbi:MAG: DUF2786 domain-containing protein [Planctomycetota bacterium]